MSFGDIFRECWIGTASASVGFSIATALYTSSRREWAVRTFGEGYESGVIFLICSAIPAGIVASVITAFT